MTLGSGLCNWLDGNAVCQDGTPDENRRYVDLSCGHAGQEEHWGGSRGGVQ